MKIDQVKFGMYANYEIEGIIIIINVRLNNLSSYSLSIGIHFGSAKKFERNKFSPLSSIMQTLLAGCCLLDVACIM